MYKFKLRTLFACAAAMSLACSQAQAQGICLPATIASHPKVTIAEALKKFDGLSLSKDEFETTAAYQARVASSQAKVSVGDLVFAIDSHVTTEFNADLGQVTVPSYAMSGTCLVNEATVSPEMKAVSFGKPARYLPSGYCITESAGSEDQGSYEATNGYGAKVVVEKSHLKNRGVFFGFGDSGQSLFGGRRSYTNDPLFIFEASVDEARSLKLNAQLLLLATPHAPFVGKGSYYGKPTFDRPQETTFSTDFIVATPLCVALADKVSGKIFATRRVGADASSQ